MMNLLVREALVLTLLKTMMISVEDGNNEIQGVNYEVPLNILKDGTQRNLADQTESESRMKAIRRGAEEEDEFFKQVTYFPYDVTRTSNGSGVIITPAPEDMRTSSA